MSGPSTLRICLAAMAPALTEAASARLRLQDTSDTQRSNKTFKLKPCYGTDSLDISKTLSVSNNDLRALGGRKRSIGEGRATHLSLANSSERDTLDLDPSQVSTIRSTCKAANPQASPPANNTLPRPNDYTQLDISKIDLVPKNSVGSSFYVSEDFQESCPRTTSILLNKLKIMNKPESGAIVNKERSNILLTENSQSEDKYQILNSNQQHAPLSQYSEPSMVNGNGDIDKGSENEEGGDKGDAPRKKLPALVNKRSVHFNESDKPSADLKKTKMGLPCTGKDPQSSGADQIVSSATSCSQLYAMDVLELKSRDETRKECARKQAYLERKVETLLRRLKRMRGKVVETHSREQLRQFVNYQHRSLQQVAKVMRSEAPGPAELKEHFLSNDEVKSMSTTELVKLVKTYQPLGSTRNHRHQSQHLTEHRGISSNLARFGGPSGSLGPVMVMEPALRTQVAEVSERLRQRIMTVSSELDSDATASSSGGESGDEEGDSTHKPKLSTSDIPPLFKRAEWRWASDRAAIVSRWTWLQAQVSDLEYRIRQQSQVHRQLRASKGGVVLGDPPSTADILRRLQGMAPTTPQETTSGSEGGAGQDGEQVYPEETKDGLEVSPFNIQSVMSNVDKQASRLSQSLGNCLSPASSRSSASAPPSMVGSPRINSSTPSPGRSPAQASIRDSSPGGSREGCPNVPTELSLTSRTSDLLHTPELQRQQQRVPPSSQSSLSIAPHLDASCQSARCRPLRSYRKRRILRTVGLHRHSQKAARLSDVRCRCSPPTNPCPMCGGRQNNTIPMDTETMALRERIALVDASFHPVLSFPEDISLSIHCEGLLKSGLWQEKPAKRSRGSHKLHHYQGSLLLSRDYHLNKNKGHQNNSNSHHHHQDKVLKFVSGELGHGETKKKKARKNVSIGSLGQNNKNSVTTVHSAASVIKNFSEKIKNKYESKAKSKGTTTKVKVLPPRPNKAKKRASKVAKDALKKKKAAEVREEEDDLEALYLEQEFCDIDAENGGGSLSASASQSSLRELSHQHGRSNRRRVDNSYDINNIVIPLSMATSTPVEQPQYKEIVTPKWRETPLQAFSCAPVAAAAAVRDSLAMKIEKTNGVARSAEQQLKPPELDSVPEMREAESLHAAEGNKTEENNEDYDEEEDLSDEKFALRHLKFELEEKKRFRNFVQYPPLRRSRARSDVSLSAMDSRDGGQSEENSLSSRPATPVLMKSLPSVSSGRGSSLEESLASLQGQRPRTMSVSTPTARRDPRQGSLYCQDSVDSQRDTVLEPWPHRIFPLATEEYEHMLKEAPPEPRLVTHEHETRYSCSNTPKSSLRLRESSVRDVTPDTVRPAETMLDSIANVADSVALSPQSVSASASSAADDDAADPEWVGGADNSTSSGSSYKRGRGRRILDDPNDPEWLGSDTPRKNKNKR
ncbi:KAT8 regulatory NSL complex subunit 1 [Elysia marginata]|uniref:KAT8 regulatory NSL complex subunit 1 n=1 Tax=Elysia marginata TaxID=1093978 RepID=A0AAV4J0K5_9GAST|nr:KAT8 regulatory NSL complex subunit 1 [Elysia marginata]